MISHKKSLRNRFSYSVDNFMAKGGMANFLALMVLFVGAIVLIAIFRFVANLILPQDGLGNIFDQWWLSFLQIADGGSIAEDTGSNWVNRVVGIVALFLGMVLFSSLVAFITNQFDLKMTELRKGRSRVLENRHTLILGFGDRGLEIIRELVIANSSEKRASVVVLAETDKTEMDDYFREKIDSLGTTRLITRSGSTSSISMLEKVAAAQARSVIILSDARGDADEEEKEHADARVLKTIMALVSTCADGAVPPIVAELHHEQKRTLARAMFPSVLKRDWPVLFLSHPWSAHTQNKKGINSAVIVFSCPLNGRISVNTEPITTQNGILKVKYFP